MEQSAMAALFFAEFKKNPVLRCNIFAPNSVIVVSFNQHSIIS